MFVIVNEKNERIRNARKQKFVHESKPHKAWKGEEAVNRVLQKLLDQGLKNLRIVEIANSDIKEEDIDLEEEAKIEESLFSNGINEKCEKCENLCKQHSLCKIIRCPSFKKISK